MSLMNKEYDCSEMKPGMDPASNFWGGAAEIYFHSRRSISVALSKYVSAVFGILISIHVVNTDVFV